MKRGKSTGKPTKAEAARIVAAKEGPCMACEVWASTVGEWRGDAAGCDYHHLKQGNIRRGHSFGIALCPWHHRGVPIDGYTCIEMRRHLGPSLMDGSRMFHEFYGSDEFLLERQNAHLSMTDDCRS